MRNHKPSLSAIRYFECAATNLSFTKASEELFVTQSAVSKQIRTLEERIGCKLFIRRGPNLELTAQGKSLLDTVSSALEIIDNGITNLLRESSNTLTLSLLPSFASLWLLPRLGELESALGDASLRFVPSYKVVDFTSETDIDAAIRLTRKNDSGLYCLQITEDRMFPVCSPAIAKQIKEIADLRNQTLIMEASLLDEWANWFSAMGHEFVAGKKWFNEDSGLQLQAAIQGQGVSLVREELVSGYLETGVLVRLFDCEYQSTAHYYFVCPEERQNDKVIARFVTWLEKLRLDKE